MVEIDCRDKDWKSHLKLNLQEGNGVALIHFDYIPDGEFCEMLALLHSCNFKLHARNGAGSIKKRKSK